MSDTTNMLPLDPVWAKRVDELAKHAASELKCTVLLVAIQENGKLAAGLEGVPEAGPLAEVVKDVPHFLMCIADVVASQEEAARAHPTQ